MKIRIIIGSLIKEAELFDTPTGKKVAQVLPIKSGFNTWGDEIYFSIPVEAGPDDTSTEVVKEGDIGYWPDGKCFCIFFGPTPISTEDEIRPASAVNVMGRVIGDPKEFKIAMNEPEIIIEPIDE